MPRLVIRKGDGTGQDHAVVSPCVVGRHASATFVLPDQNASRNHFRILNAEGAWTLEDLGSTNGTLLNGRRITRERLKDGDRIVAGTTELEFVQKDLLAGAARPAAPAPARAAAPVPPAAAVPARPAPAAPAPARPAPARPAPAAAATPPAPPGPPKPKFQAPIPTKKRR